MTDVLLPRCVCGAETGELIERAGLRLLRCACGVMRLETSQTLEDYGQQYSDGSYHASSDRHAGCVPYADRYTNDYQVASLRVKRYCELVDRLRRLPHPPRVLDIGAANGAFVDYCSNIGWDAWGIDPYPVLDPLRQQRILNGTLEQLPRALLGKRFELITMHDVLEHLIDPVAALHRARALCSIDGVVVIDVPDVSVPAGEHHFKLEHVWYFCETALIDLLRRTHFEWLTIDRPIAGKLVVYGGAA